MSNTPAAALLADLQARGIELQANGGRVQFRPKAAMTCDLAERVKACRPELLAILTGPAPQPEAPAETRADREWRRFLAVCRERPDGNGWYDPRELQRFERLTGQHAARPDAKQPQVAEETAAERAARYRAEWEREGYPPGVTPKPA